PPYRVIACIGYVDSAIGRDYNFVGQTECRIERSTITIADKSLPRAIELGLSAFLRDLVERPCERIHVNAAAGPPDSTHHAISVFRDVDRAAGVHSNAVREGKSRRFAQCVSRIVVTFLTGSGEQADLTTGIKRSNCVVLLIGDVEQTIGSKAHSSWATKSGFVATHTTGIKTREAASGKS